MPKLKILYHYPVLIKAKGDYLGVNFVIIITN